MKVTWLGQAGLYIEVGGLAVMADPYLSDSIGQTQPDKGRRMPVEDWMLELEPQVLLLTHDHADHYDPDTVGPLLARCPPMTVLAPEGCWEKVRALGGGHNCVRMEPEVQWTQGDVRFTALPACHSDPHAIGVLIEHEGARLYITGDTLYSTRVLDSLPRDGVDAVALPINGAGNNMNAADAARFAHHCGAHLAIPIHWGMLDGVDPAQFDFEPKHIPVYGETFIIGED